VKHIPDQLAGRSESPQSPTLQVGPSTIAAGSAQLLSDVGSPGLPQCEYITISLDVFSMFFLTVSLSLSGQ
jgi:hypothetical protein